MKKLVSALFLLLNFAIFAYDPAIDEAEDLYKEAKQLTVEYIASCRTLKTVSAKEITPEQREAVDAIIRHQEAAINAYDHSLRTINSLKEDYDYLGPGEKEAALNTVITQNQTIRTVINGLKNAIEMNREAIDNY